MENRPFADVLYFLLQMRIFRCYVSLPEDKETAFSKAPFFGGTHLLSLYSVSESFPNRLPFGVTEVFSKDSFAKVPKSKELPWKAPKLFLPWLSNVICIYI